MAMYGSTRPTDQRAGVKPIAFVLQVQNKFFSPVTLKIRPEELTRTELSRATVSQTLGRKVEGWVDDFGAGLPSVSISGHTGWRASPADGQDGAMAFESLNQLVAHSYHDAKQAAIDAGIDPAKVKLIFVDMLDDFTYSVVPTQFALRRSKSRPLLFQYNIAMQAIDSKVDNPLMIVPASGDLTAGLSALERGVAAIEGYAKTINGWITEAVKYKDEALAPIGHAVATFTNLSARVFRAVNSVVTNAGNAVTSTANTLIGYAADMAKVGVNLNRTIANIESLPDTLKYDISRVASAYNEMYCIFKNSLKTRKRYMNYADLYGASNCSSTSGGSAASAYASSNSFAAIAPDTPPVMLTSGAKSSMVSIGLSDPVMAPMSIQELDRNTRLIINGVSFQ